MSKSRLRIKFRQILRNKISHAISDHNENNLSQSAIVFSPHPDDETLGCGGTIIKKIRSGAEVKIVFMTDGQKSHQHLISENKLKDIRRNEAVAASKKLGIEETPIFLGFVDGELSKNQNYAVQKVLEILVSQQPHEVFVPYYKEPLLGSADHLSTNRIVSSALQAYGRKVRVYEYPVWFWYHWPWVSIPKSNLKRRLAFLKDSFVSPWSLLKDFRCSTFVGDVLEIKRNSLNQYASQTRQLIPDPRWTTLSDISDGEFLECFFQDYEIFHQYVLHK